MKRFVVVVMLGMSVSASAFAEGMVNRALAGSHLGELKMSEMSGPSVHCEALRAKPSRDIAYGDERQQSIRRSDAGTALE